MGVGWGGVWTSSTGSVSAEDKLPEGKLSACKMTKGIRCKSRAKQSFCCKQINSPQWYASVTCSELPLWCVTYVDQHFTSWLCQSCHAAVLNNIAAVAIHVISQISTPNATTL